jgi:hypothetical protein
VAGYGDVPDFLYNKFENGRGLLPGNAAAICLN